MVKGDATPSAQRGTLLLGSAALLLLGGFAMVFAKERLYADAGYFLVRIIDGESFHLINHRWLMPLIQWMPLLGVKSGAGLPVIVMLYSLGNVVLATFLFFFTLLVLRDRLHALVLLATQFIGLSHALFCPVFELYYGAMLLVVMRAVLHTTRIKGPMRHCIALVLFVLIASCHFLGLLVLLLMLVLERIWERPRLCVSFILALALVMAHRFLDISAYENNALHTVLLRLRLHGIGWIFAPSRLWGHALQAWWHYPEVILLAAIAILTAAKRKAWWPLGVFIGGHLAIYILISLYFPDGTHDRYRETLDYTHTVWTLVTVAWALGQAGAQHRMTYLVFAVLLILRTAWAVHIGATFTERTIWMEDRISMARAHDVRKAVDTAHRTFVPPGYNNAPLYGPAAFEFLLLSAWNGPDGTTILVSFPYGEPDAWALEKAELEIAREGVMLPTKSSGRYFNIPHGPFAIIRE